MNAYSFPGCIKRDTLQRARTIEDEQKDNQPKTCDERCFVSNQNNTLDTRSVKGDGWLSHEPDLDWM